MLSTLSNMSPTIALFIILSLQSACSLAAPLVSLRDVAVFMGAAASFGTVSYTTLTSTGETVITGDAGVFPGSDIPGFPPGLITGTTSAAGIAAFNAKASCLTAYNNAAGLVSTEALASADLGNLTLGPGVYTFPTSAASLSTTLTLDGTSNPNGQFVFQISSTLATSVGSEIVLIGGAQACNVYFAVGSSVTILANSTLQANILAYTSISVAEAASNNGTLCALNGAVTLINNALIAQPVCYS